MYTLTLVLNKDKTKVLMCYHKIFKKNNYIGGKIEFGENPLEASYRELFEETGISKNDIELIYIRQERVMLNPLIGTDDYELYVTAGILKNDIELVVEKNPLLWVDINNLDMFLNSYGDGNNYTFLVEALRVLDNE